MIDLSSLPLLPIVRSMALHASQAQFVRRTNTLDRDSVVVLCGWLLLYETALCEMRHGSVICHQVIRHQNRLGQRGRCAVTQLLCRVTVLKYAPLPSTSFMYASLWTMQPTMLQPVNSPTTFLAQTTCRLRPAWDLRVLTDASHFGHRPRWVL
jgi:hypothetical protein